MAVTSGTMDTLYMHGIGVHRGAFDRIHPSRDPILAKFNYRGSEPIQGQVACPMKLSTKASLLIVTLVVALFVPLSSIVLHVQEAALRKATFNTVDGVVQSWAHLASSFVENAHRDANSLAATLPAEALRSGRMDGIEAHLRKVYDTQDFGNGVFLLGPQGDILLDYPPHPEVRGRSMAFREYFSRTLAEKRGVVSAPYTSLRTGRPVLTVTAPILDEQASVVAVVACSYDLLDPGILGGIRDQRLGRTGYLYLFDRTRLMILHPDSARILQRDIPLGANKALDQAIEGLEGPAATINSRGIPMLVSFRSIRGTPWILGAQIPQAEAFEATGSSRRLMLLTTSLSLLVILAVSLLVIRRLSRPLRQLHEAASAIALELEGGQPDRNVLPTLASIHSRDEIGTLAQTFRELVERQQRSLGLLKQAASEWERTFDAVNEAILCLDGDGRVLRINRMAADWFRVSPEAAIGRDGRALVLEGQATSEAWPTTTELDTEHTRSWTDALPHRAGTFEFRASPLLQEGRIAGMILAVRDFTEQARKEEDIRKQAFFDALTGLPNRLLLMDRLAQTLAAGARSQRDVGVLFLDLDHFKEINDTWGHEMGDAVLKEVAGRLKKLVRREDTAARLGGDEFVMVLSGIARDEDLGLVAGKVLAAIQEPFLLEGHDLRLGTSIGIAIGPRDGREGPILMKHADAAMYQAKRGGRSGFRLYSEDQPAEV
jgi:diguanylate cyclase (GGDEF)-like protein